MLFAFDAWQSAQSVDATPLYGPHTFAVPMCVVCDPVVGVALWQIEQLACVVFHAGFTTGAPVTVPLLWHAFVPHVPNVEPGTVTSPPEYVNVTVPVMLIVPFPCVAAVAVVWHAPHAIVIPNVVDDSRCG